MNESKKPGDAGTQASDPEDLLEIMVVPPNQTSEIPETSEQDAPTPDLDQTSTTANGAGRRTVEDANPEALTTAPDKEETALASDVSVLPSSNGPILEIETTPVSSESESVADKQPDEFHAPVTMGEPDDSVAPLSENEPQENWLALLVKETLETVVLAVVIFLLIRIGIQNYRIEGNSMEPNFHNGEYLLVNKLAYRLGEFQRGDVVVFKYPGDTTKDYIKRVIGLPGDTVEIREGVLLVNGQEVNEPYDIMPMNFITEPPVVVEPGYLYVMGDNRPASSDTRDWGLLAEDLVIGQAWLAIFPLEQFGLVDHPELHFTPGMAQGP